MDPNLTPDPQMLAGRRILVAGGAGNVGRVIVRSLLDAGASVVVPSRSAERIERLRSELGDARGGLIALHGDLADEREGGRVLDAAIGRGGALDGAVASLGTFIPAPSILEARPDDLRRALNAGVVAHFMVARTVIPALRDGAAYTFVNGLLAFEPRFPGTGLLSIAGAAQAMFARLAMTGTRPSIRVNEVVLYTSFGRPDDEERNRRGVSKRQVADFITLLASDRAEGVRGQTIHLTSTAKFEALRPAASA